MKTKTLKLSGSRKIGFFVFAIIFVLASVAGLTIRNFANNADAATISVSTFSDLQTALTTAGTNTIALANDIDFTSTTNPNILLAANSNITIDGNGFSLIREAGSSGQMLQVPATTTLDLENVTVNGNNISTANSCLYDNGGTLNLAANTIVENCTNNAGDGGGIYFNAGSTGTMNSSIIRSNTVQGNTPTSGHGAGAFIGAGTIGVSVVGSTFINNSANQSGGAIMSDGPLTVTNSTFTDNTSVASGSGAVGFSATASELSISDSSFTGNSAYTNGGAVSVGGVDSDITINDSTFTDNVAIRSAGAIMLNSGFSGTLTVNDSRFNHNQAGINGGAVAVAATTTQANINGSTFVNNIATQNGGAITTGDLNNLFVNFTSSFSDNSASTSSRIDPADQALYDTNILATTWSLPLPFNGYNNYDISYTSDLSTDICQYNSSLWADDVSCTAPTEPTTPVVPGPPNTGMTPAKPEIFVKTTAGL